MTHEDHHILYRLDEIKTDLAELKRESKTELGEIKEHVQETNGRVTGLERTWERAKGFAAALGLAVPVLTAVAVKLIAG